MPTPPHSGGIVRRQSSQESGVRSQESGVGVRSQESGVGVRSQESGVRSQESGVEGVAGVQELQNGEGEALVSLSENLCVGHNQRLKNGSD